jgi:hypothetical protein
MVLVRRARFWYCWRFQGDFHEETETASGMRHANQGHMLLFKALPEATFFRQADRSGKKRNQKNAGYLRNWPGEMSRLKAFFRAFVTRPAFLPPDACTGGAATAPTSN